MNKYTVTLYTGTIETIDEVLLETTVDADNINDVSFLKILPKEACDNIYYIRKMIISPDEYSYDYGKYTTFIRVKKVEEK